jgi:hypothetical protein
VLSCSQTVNLKTKTFVRIIENNNSDKSRAFFTEEDFAPPIFNIWTFSKKTKYHHPTPSARHSNQKTALLPGKSDSDFSGKSLKMFEETEYHHPTPSARRSNTAAAHSKPIFKQQKYIAIYCQMLSVRTTF